jgi:hypothetical protein
MPEQTPSLVAKVEVIPADDGSWIWIVTVEDGEARSTAPTADEAEAAGEEFLLDHYAGGNFVFVVGVLGPSGRKPWSAMAVTKD